MNELRGLAPELANLKIKNITLSKSGKATFDGKDYVFDPSTDFGTLDWGRGVWTYDNTWYWGSGNMDIDGHSFGFNIGYGFGDMSQASENAVFVDGVCHKTGRVFIDIPMDNRNEKWVIRSDDKRFEVTVTPIVNSDSKHVIGLKTFNEKVMFGRMSGTVVLDNGESITVNDITCFFEESVNKY